MEAKVIGHEMWWSWWWFFCLTNVHDFNAMRVYREAFSGFSNGDDRIDWILKRAYRIAKRTWA